MQDTYHHVPVLLRESVDALAIRRDGIYVDVTLGGGGHSREVLRRLGSGGHLFSFDQDAEAIAQCEAEAEATEQGDGPTWTLVRSNFRYLRSWMRYYGIDAVDGVLADLGVSSRHFDAAERGFSFRADAPLDMRMNQQARLKASDVVNTYTQEQLATIFRLYGELQQANRLAAAIVRTRQAEPIATTAALAGVLAPLLGRDRESKDMAKAFQALRIEVNHEMDALRDMLLAATALLTPGGRLAVIAYHSLEDRIVKNLVRSGNIEGHVEQDIYGRTTSPLVAVGKPLTPAADELATNSRSRSARLRIAEKTAPH